MPPSLPRFGDLTVTFRYFPSAQLIKAVAWADRLHAIPEYVQISRVTRLPPSPAHRRILRNFGRPLRRRS
jgi:hypothetical protein